MVAHWSQVPTSYTYPEFESGLSHLNLSNLFSLVRSNKKKYHTTQEENAAWHQRQRESNQWDATVFLCREKRWDVERQPKLNHRCDFSIDLDMCVLLCVDIMTNHWMGTSLPAGIWTQIHTPTHTKHAQTLLQTAMHKHTLVSLARVCDCTVAVWLSDCRAASVWKPHAFW